MEYFPMVPPFEVDDFSKLNKRDAQKHFDWYVDEIPNRIKILKDVYAEDKRNPNELNLSSDSLVPLWEWFIPKVEIIRLSKKEHQKLLKEYPEWIWDSIDDREISIKSLSIAMDIGLYFAETMIRNHPELAWGFITKPKSYVDLNRPAIVGFPNKVSLCPSRILRVLASRVADGEKNPKMLLNIYLTWARYL